MLRNSRIVFLSLEEHPSKSLTSASLFLTSEVQTIASRLLAEGAHPHVNPAAVAA